MSLGSETLLGSAEVLLIQLPGLFTLAAQFVAILRRDRRFAPPSVDLLLEPNGNAAPGTLGD